MSGKPNQTEVEALRQNLRRMIQISHQKAEAEKGISGRQKTVRELSEEYSGLAKKSLELLTGMDVSDSQRGNYGWEGRQLWFLQELVESSELAGRLIPGVKT